MHTALDVHVLALEAWSSTPLVQHLGNHFMITDHIGAALARLIGIMVWVPALRPEC